MNAITQGFFTNIPVFVVLAGMTFLAVIAYKNLRAEMREGFLTIYRNMDQRFAEMKQELLKVNYQLKDHDVEIKRTKRKLKRKMTEPPK